MRPKNYIINRSWAEVNLDAIAQNIQAIRKMTWKSTEIMAVVKADAYGHGVAHVANTLLENGADRLAVSLIDEGIELRQMGIKAPILILSYSDPRRAHEIVKYRLTQTVYSWDLINALDEAAAYLGQVAPVHVKIDTGMGRVGLVAGFDSVNDIKAINSLPHVTVEGVFTHFATADEEDTKYIRKQFDRFITICTELEKAGVYVPIKHCCNSAATLRFPEMHLDMVRPGLILYGLLPANCEAFASNFRPAMSVKSNIIMSKTLAAGQSISYGSKFTTERESHIATVPIGYADGYMRVMSGKAKALISGVEVPVVGSICMDSCMMDVTEIDPAPQLGDEVVLFGHQMDKNGKIHVLPIESLADWAGTINYEITCLVGKRVPRVYLSHGSIVDITSKIW